MILQYLQELRLERLGQLPDPIEEDGSRVGQLELPRLRSMSPGESAALVAEQLALQ